MTVSEEYISANIVNTDDLDDEFVKLEATLLSEFSINHMYEKAKAYLPRVILPVVSDLFRWFVSKYAKCNRQFSTVHDTGMNLKCKMELCKRMADGVKSAKSRCPGDNKEQCVKAVEKEYAKWNKRYESFKSRYNKYSVN